MTSTLPLWLVLLLLIGASLVGFLSADRLRHYLRWWLPKPIRWHLYDRFVFWRERDRAVAFWLRLTKEERRVIGEAIVNAGGDPLEEVLRTLTPPTCSVDMNASVVMKLISVGVKGEISESFLTTLQVWAVKEETDPAPYDLEATIEKMRAQRKELASRAT